ncbi:FmdB family zinc ribbon protein [Pusillimonas noertemannii]|uniref:FmdB family zinc ribbon protein n=1 Tax=Pusillimonas noertemannii TaxID=305977 RepID=UPI00333F437D
MPIYAYKCSACGHAQDVLQKMSDPVLTDCPECGQSTYAKQVTAAGFQLKGSGWYVTDFRDGGKKAGSSSSGESSSSSSASSSGPAPASSDTAAAAKPADTSSSSTAAAT